MNWYRIAKLYQEIAHPSEDGQLYQLWIMKNGEPVKKSPIYDSTEVRLSHANEFANEMDRDTYTGRYDPQKNELSIAGSYGNEDNSISKPIIEKVIRAFPEAKKVYIFTVYGDELGSIDL